MTTGMAKRCKHTRKFQKSCARQYGLERWELIKQTVLTLRATEKILLSGLMLGKNDQIKMTYHAYTLKSAEQAYYLKSCGYINYSNKIGRNR